MTVYVLECFTSPDVLGIYSSLEWAKSQLLGDWSGDVDECCYLLVAGDGEEVLYMITPIEMDKKAEVRTNE